MRQLTGRNLKPIIGLAFAVASNACEKSAPTESQLPIVEPPAVIKTSGREACAMKSTVWAGLILYIRNPKTEERIRSVVGAREESSVTVKMAVFEQSEKIEVLAQSCENGRCGPLVDVEPVIFPNGHKGMEVSKPEPFDLPCSSLTITISPKRAENEVSL